MTDLERARQLLADDPDEMDEAWLASIIAAARREGAEEMRERAAIMEAALRKIAALDKHSGSSLRARAGSEIARAALASLTPEEPT